MPDVFVSMSDTKVASLIDLAVQRVVLAVPAFRDATAAAITRAVERLGSSQVSVIVDCDEHVFRLGYGDIEAVTASRNAGCSIRQAPGLRIGALIVDDTGWVFAPTALFVANEVDSDERPNAIVLANAAVTDVCRALLGSTESLGEHQSRNAGNKRTPTDAAIPVAPIEDQGRHGANKPMPTDVEIGVASLSAPQIDCAQDSLRQAPPIPFDIARQVRVFTPYIQYIEMMLHGCAIERKRLEVPPSIQGLDPNDEIGRRLRTTFDLIERNSKLSSKPLDAELKKIREDFTRPLGKPWGRVLLRDKRSIFDKRIAQFRVQLDRHRESVLEALEDELTKSKEQLIDHFLPLAAANPPDTILGQIIGEATEDKIRAWLDRELTRVFPEPNRVISEMSFYVQYRDVTYETLTSAGFAERLRNAFPHVDWDKPFSEFDAARAREGSEQARNDSIASNNDLRSEQGGSKGSTYA
jgi:hypothetical protein